MVTRERRAATSKSADAVNRRRTDDGRCARSSAFLVARQVFELGVASAHFLAQGSIGRVKLVPFFVHGKPERFRQKIHR